MVDKFEELVKRKFLEKTERFCDALLWGFSEARSNGDFSFVKSCQDFFDRTGFLTEKQVAALVRMDAEKLKTYKPFDDDSEDPDMNGLEDSDFAGGFP